MLIVLMLIVLMLIVLMLIVLMLILRLAHRRRGWLGNANVRHDAGGEFARHRNVFGDERRRKR